MLASAGVGHDATDFMQKSAKNAAYGSCTVDEIVRAYAWFHKQMRGFGPIRGFRKGFACKAFEKHKF